MRKDANTENKIKKENKKDGKKVRKQAIRASNAEKEKERERNTRDIRYDGNYARVGGRARAPTRALVVASLHR